MKCTNIRLVIFVKTILKQRRKLVKYKDHRFRWFKLVNENLTSRRKQFWIHVSQCRKTDTDLIHIEINGILINKPRDIGAFSEYFQLVYSSSCPGTFPFINLPT
jgi:hypothetical protein